MELDGLATLRSSDSSDNNRMDARRYDLHGICVVELAREGTPLRDDRDAVDVIAAASEHPPEITVRTGGPQVKSGNGVYLALFEHAPGREIS